MSKVRLAIHSANPQLQASLRRLAGGLDHRYDSYFIDTPPEKFDASFYKGANFVLGGLAGTSEQIAVGLKTLKGADEHLRVLGKRVPLGVIVDTGGKPALNALRHAVLRLCIRLSPLIVPADSVDVRTEVEGFSWTETELDRVRVALGRATAPFNYGGI